MEAEAKTGSRTTLIGVDLLFKYADVRNAHRLLLGRPVNSPAAVMMHTRSMHTEMIENLVKSDDFRSAIAVHLILTGQVASGRYEDEPAAYLLAWAAAYLPLDDRSRSQLLEAKSWREVLRLMFSDQRFSSFLNGCGLSYSAESLSRSLGKYPDDYVIAAGDSCNSEMLQSFSSDASFIVANTSFEEACKTIVTRKNLASGKVLHGLRLTDQGTFLPTGDDPQMLIARSLMPGFYILSMNITYLDPATSAAPVTGKFYVDFGDGFSENNMWKISTASGKFSIKGLIEIRRRVHRLRFDPHDNACSFKLEALAFQAIELRV